MKIRLGWLARRIETVAVDTWLDAASTMRRARSLIVGRRHHASAQRKRILVVDEMLPDARFGAGYPRAAEILNALGDSGWDVTMYPMIASRAELAIIRARFAAHAVRFVPSHGPKGLRRLMQENRETFDVTLISRPATMQIYSRIRSTLRGFRTRCLYDAEAVFAAREWKRLELLGHPMTESAYEYALDEEIALVADADAVITVTETEARLFRARSARPVHVVKHTIAIRREPAGFNGRADLLFVGRCTGPRELSPNVDSLHWFVHEVMPLIDAMTNADYRLVVVGLADPDIVLALASNRVVFMGVVDDLDAIYDRCRVFVAPTRFAAGIPLKVVEAAAAGIPCVVTELLARQLGFHDGVELRAAGSAMQFAEHCVALYEKPDEWARLREAAKVRVTQEYSHTAFRATLQEALATRQLSHSKSRPAVEQDLS